MYRQLFNATTDAIKVLQDAQQKTEELYLEAPGVDVRVVEGGDKNEE
jgi:hypothetical protein